MRTSGVKRQFIANSAGNALIRRPWQAFHSDTASAYVVRFNSALGRGAGHYLFVVDMAKIRRLQRFARGVVRRRRDRLLAVMMAFHPRLGTDSALGRIADVIEAVVRK